MIDLFAIIAAVCLGQLAVILAMVETDRACKGEPLRIVWGRRIGFGAGGAALLYGGLTGDLAGTALLMAGALVPICSINIVSIAARNRPPLHGHRFLSRATAGRAWRRYP
jgi:hypothetical protein